MLSFILLAGIGSYLVVGLLCVAAFAVAGVGAYFYLRAKNREALDPAKGLTAGDAPVALGEMRELTSRIEEIVTSQQDHGETQRAHLSRKIDQVRESVESQHHAVSGLRNELRHEISKRDAEMNEIRHQIASVRDGVGLPPAEFKALPPSAAELGAPETEAEMMTLSFDEPEEVTFTEEATFADEATFTEEPIPSTDPQPDEEAPAFDEMAFAPLDAEPGDAGLAFAFEEDEAHAEPPVFFFEDESFEVTADVPDPLAPEPEAPAMSPFVFDEEETAEDAPVELFAETEPEVPAFAFEEDVQMSMPAEEPDEAFQVVSFLEPEAAPEEPSADASAMPAFAFEEDDGPTAEDAPSVFEPSPVETASAPAFAFGDDDSMSDEAQDADPLAMEPALGVAASLPVFAFEEDESPADGTPAEDELAPMSLRFEEPTAIDVPAEDEPTVTEAPVVETPMSLAFEDDEDEPAVAAQAGPAVFEEAYADASAPTTRNGNASAHAGQAPTFAPAIMAPPGDVGPGDPPPTAWISRSDRQPPEAPVETIGGIEIERVGDVPPADPTPEPSAEPTPAFDAAGLGDAADAVAPDLSVPEPSVPEPAPASAPAPLEPDEFPQPVVASELAIESLDFGIDVDAELAAAGQAPLDEFPADEATLDGTPMNGLSFADAAGASRIRHAPVPPLRMEAETEEEENAPVPAPRPVAPTPAAMEPEALEVEPYDPPEGAEDLTIISSVDMDTQRALHMVGVLTLDEIARWGRTDARRIGAQVGVSEETIMHQWVFEAQSALFERYSRR